MNKGVIILLVLVIASVTIGTLLLFKVITPKSTIVNIITSKVPTRPALTSDPNKRGTTQISLTNNGFEPNKVTVSIGNKVIWTNNSNKAATVNSDNHPTHLLNPFLNLGGFSPGETLRTIFPNAGTYTYHNHLNPAQTGTVIVMP